MFNYEAKLSAEKGLEEKGCERIKDGNAWKSYFGEA